MLMLPTLNSNNSVADRIKQVYDLTFYVDREVILKYLLVMFVYRTAGRYVIGELKLCVS